MPDPHALAAALPRTAAVIDDGVRAGAHVGAQVYVSVDLGGRREVMADAAVGLARPDGTPMSPATIVPWLSAGKPVVAACVAQLWERGLLDLDDPVARHLPAFAARGKEGVTIRHILTHTSGFRAVLGPWERGTYAEAVAAVFDARLEPGWVPGRRAGYHVASSWYVLAELVRVLDGRPLERYVREALFAPMGMHDSSVGMAPGAFRAYGERIGVPYDTSRPGGGPKPIDEDATEAACAGVKPGSNARGPARDLGRFYEVMLNRGAAAPDEIGNDTTGRPTAGVKTSAFGSAFASIPESAGRASTGARESSASSRGIAPPGPETVGATSAAPYPGNRAGPGGAWLTPRAAAALPPPRVLLPQTVDAMTARHRVGMTDLTFRQRIDWGLGFIVNSAHYGAESVPYGFGPHASPRAFGHGGSQSASAFADPEFGLAVAIVWNGRPGEAAHDRRLKPTLAAVYEDLGIGWDW